MQFRNNIINSALLGTEKKQPDTSEFPELLRNDIECILKETTDNEDKFLRVAALALSFYKCGVRPLKLSAPADEAPEEEYPYPSQKSSGILKEILQNKYHTLIWYWCKNCYENKFIVHPQLLPQLLEWGVATKKNNAGLIRNVVGNRGMWLSKFSEEWKFLLPEKETEDWETGTSDQRTNYLNRLRSTDAVAALKMVQRVWKEENASGRIGLLETLTKNISLADEPFLKEILNDKSQKVKDKAWELLKLIPGSEIIRLYQKILKDSIIISQGKMLGLISRTTVTIKLNLSGEDIFKTGIQNISSNKKISDDQFILMQLIEVVPPEFWEAHFDCKTPEAVKLFADKDELKLFQAAVCNAVLKFGNRTWAKEIFDQFEIHPVSMLKLIEPQQRIIIAEKLLQENVNEVVDAVSNPEIAEWTKKFARGLFSVMAANPGSFNKTFLEGISLYLSSSSADDLENFTPADEWKKNHWKIISNEIREYINIREKIKNSFKNEQHPSSTR